MSTAGYIIIIIGILAQIRVWILNNYIRILDEKEPLSLFNYLLDISIFDKSFWRYFIVIPYLTGSKDLKRLRLKINIFTYLIYISIFLFFSYITII